MRLFTYLVLFLLPFSFLPAAQEAAPSEEELFLRAFGKKKETESFSAPVYIHGKYADTTQVTVKEDSVYLPARFLYKHLAPHIQPGALEDVKKIKVEGEWIAQGFLDEKGYVVSLDPVSLTIYVTIPAQDLLTQYHQITHARREEKEAEVILPAAASGYLNMHMEEGFYGDADTTRRQPFLLNFESVVNLKGLAWQNIFSYEEDREFPWRYSKQSLYYDIQERNLRLTLGDLYPSLSEFRTLPSLAGFHVEKSFLLDPEFVTAPGVERVLYLEEKGRVEVWVNGIKNRVFNLQRGPHVFSDFSSYNGVNNIELKVFDQYGREQHQVFSYIYEPRLLAAGLCEYSALVGFPSEVREGVMHYDTKSPHADFWVRRGLNDTKTVSLFSQWRERRSVTGAALTSAQSWGTAELGLAASTGRQSGAALIARLSNYLGQSGWQKKLQWNLGATGYTKGYRALVADELLPPPTLLFHGVASYPYESVGYFSCFVEHERSRTVGSSSRVGGQFLTSLTNSVDFSLDTSFRKSPGEKNEWRGVFMLTWHPSSHRIEVNGHYDTKLQEKAVNVSHWRAFSRSHLNLDASFVDSKKGSTGNGLLQYSSDRFLAETSHTRSYPKGRKYHTETRAALGTSIVFADGQWGISRPVEDSFVLMTPHPSLQKASVLMNPSDTQYLSSSSRYLPAVSATETPYRRTTYWADVPDQPLGSDIGSGRYVVVPGFMRGVKVVVGTAGTVILDGHLVTTTGEPIALTGGEVAPISSSVLDEPVPFFSNRTGRFRLMGLSPGEYEIRFFDSHYLSEKITIPEESTGLYKLGELIVQEATKNKGSD